MSVTGITSPIVENSNNLLKETVVATSPTSRPKISVRSASVTCPSSNFNSLNIPLIEIEEFVETTIVLKKDKKNEFGISVVGGSDTYLETICVSAVHPDGNAFKDGRVKRGDIILAVNDHSLRDVTSADALKLLREAQSPVRLVVLRENPLLMFTTPEEPTKFVTIELRKAAVTDRLGLSIMHGEVGQGVFITWVRPGSIAARHGRFLQGDRILEVNGQNVQKNSQSDLASIIQNLDGAIVFLLGRVPSLTHSIQEWARMKVGSPGRIRTSTWSYTAKEKLQSQRPSLPVTTVGKESSYELLVPVPIPFPIPPSAPSGLAFRRFAAGATDLNSPSHRSGIVQSMRRTFGPEGAKLPLVVPLKIEEELLHSGPISPLKERRTSICPKIEVTNC
ncbi:hypothetical protein CHUAL_003471 [Chamberlinius hualienensis]